LRTDYVLVDYENVQPRALELLDQAHVKVVLFVGASQAKVSFETASALQQMGSNASYVKISGSGPNALDFHIAYYIGQMVAKDPAAHFHIISKDTGFDPLVEHLKTKNLSASRSCEVSEIPLIKAARAAAENLPPMHSASPKPLVENLPLGKAASQNAAADKLDVIIAKLRAMRKSPPRTVKTLSGTINSLFHKRLSPTELSRLIKELRAKGFVVVKGARVAYKLPA
jgi:hypothetical protein